MGSNALQSRHTCVGLMYFKGCLRCIAPVSCLLVQCCWLCCCLHHHTLCLHCSHEQLTLSALTYFVQSCDVSDAISGWTHLLHAAFTCKHKLLADTTSCVQFERAMILCRRSHTKQCMLQLLQEPTMDQTRNSTWMLWQLVLIT